MTMLIALVLSYMYEFRKSILTFFFLKVDQKTGKMDILKNLFNGVCRLQLMS